jgi:hypothetical protein
LVVHIAAREETLDGDDDSLLRISLGSCDLAFTYQYACFSGLSVLAEERRATVETLFLLDKSMDLLTGYAHLI